MTPTQRSIVMTVFPIFLEIHKITIPATIAKARRIPMVNNNTPRIESASGNILKTLKLFACADNNGNPYPL